MKTSSGALSDFEAKQISSQLLCIIYACQSRLQRRSSESGEPIKATCCERCMAMLFSTYLYQLNVSPLSPMIRTVARWGHGCRLGREIGREPYGHVLILFTIGVLHVAYSQEVKKTPAEGNASM